MDLKSKKITAAVLTSVLGVAVAGIPADAMSKSKTPDVEKCYGIVKKGKNDCGTPKHACAAQSKTNGAKSEWMFVLKGNCERIVGGSLNPQNGTQPTPTQSGNKKA